MDSPNTGAMDFQSQLFRYAQDFQELISQHSQLQQRHQSALQSLGRTSLSRDLLTLTIAEGCTPYIVTDTRGTITQVSAEAQALLGESGLHWTGLPLLQLLPANQRASLTTLLQYLQDVHGNEAIELRQIDLFDGQDFDGTSRFDVMVVPLQTYAQLEYFWLMQPAQPGVTDDMAVLTGFGLLADSAKGLLVTDASGTIRVVNPALTQITGFEAAELLGHSPKLLSSGRHDAAFYKAFWDELLGTGSWSGEFFNRRKNGQIYPEWKTVKAVRNASGVTIAYLSVFADSAHHNDAEELARLAYHDALTGMPNRRLLEDRMAQALKLAQRDASGFSLLFIDLDRFKPINDTLGHKVGDLVLQEVSQRLTRSVRQGDTAARTGGDEFVILLQNAVAPAHIETIVNGLLAKLSEPIAAGEHQLMIGASIGCARYPQDASDTATLVKHADNAMYAAKCFGGNHFCFHDPLGHAQGHANLGLDLWRAIEREELRLVYQPQVGTNGQLRGCEALLRWAHPMVGEVSPATFIPIAETNGAILPMGDWVLETACRQLKQWQQQGLPRITMSVNVAARQLGDPGFPARVAQILARTGVAPHDLELEITESEALHSESNGYHPLQILRATGIQLAIDDFGTGFSSLSRLQFLPVDCLKMDQSFVRALASGDKAHAISQCFVSMGLAMGMQVVAEGVETEAQHQTLIAQGCQLIQGYLTGRPMAPEAFLASFLHRPESTFAQDITL